MFVHGRRLSLSEIHLFSAGNSCTMKNEPVFFISFHPDFKVQRSLFHVGSVYRCHVTRISEFHVFPVGVLFRTMTLCVLCEFGKFHMQSCL